MNPYTNSLQRLHTAILGNTPEIAIDLLGRKTPSLANRLNAYIQGYRIRLCKAIEADYPTLKHYLNTETFEDYAADYVEDTPSYSYTIDQYPLGFANYLTEKCNDTAVISIATLESAIAEVFWLPDSDAFAPDADFSMDQLMGLELKQRTASKLLKLNCDAEAYLTTFRSGEVPSIAQQPCYLMVVRHHNEVHRHRLTEAEYTLLTAVTQQRFTEALEQVTQSHSELTEPIATHLSEWLTKWISHGFFK